MRRRSPGLPRAMGGRAACLRDRVLVDPLQAFEFGLDLAGCPEPVDDRGEGKTPDADPGPAAHPA